MWLAIAISLAALAVSVLAFYERWLRPFSPKFTIGAPVLTWAIRQSMRLGQINTLQIDMNVSVTNVGAQHGIVGDLRIRVESEDKKIRIAFVPESERDPSIFFLNTNLPPEKKTSDLLNQWVPFTLGSRATVSKMVEFIDHGLYEDKPTNLSDLLPGTYDLQLQYRRLGEDSWKEVRTERFEVTELTMDILPKGGSAIMLLETERLRSKP
ncbi:hypothetical protein ES707_09697 [subsurface metagenome]